jgi:FMN reductase
MNAGSPVSLAVLCAGVGYGRPTRLLAVNSGSRWQPPDIEQVMRERLSCLHAEPVPTVVVAGPADWEESPSGDPTRLREHIDQAAAEFAAAMSSDRR